MSGIRHGERIERWLLLGLGLLVVAFELITLVGVGLELVRHGPSVRNRVFSAAFLLLSGGAVGLLGRAAKNRWFPKAKGLVAAGLFGPYLIALAP